MKFEKTISVNISNDELLDEMSWWTNAAQINFIKKMMTEGKTIDVDKTLSLIDSLVKMVCKELKNGHYVKSGDDVRKKRLNTEIAKITEAVTNFIDFCNNPEYIDEDVDYGPLG